MSFLSNLFGGSHQKNPADEANKYIGQIPGTTKPYYDPYINAGRGALDTLQGQYGNLLNDPQGFYNRMAQGYKPSEGYQTRLKAAMQGAENASASGGMLGTPQDELQRGQMAEGLASKDFEDYLNHVLGIYGLGLGGEEGLNRTGFDASKGYADILGQTLGQQGQYAYSGQAGKNQADAQGSKNIMGLISTILPYLAGA